MGSSTNHQLLHAFPIVGMAGLGKTALARSVSEKVLEGQLFDKTVWISVSDNFEELTVLSEMLKALGEDMAGGADSIGETLEHLSKELQGKRFLLVLDDVWNEDVDKWDGLKKCLLEVGGSNGSAVLVTTRSGQAASIILETFPGRRHDLKPLSEAECWSIFREKVSGEPLPRDWEVIGKEIASKCGGVPLVAHFLGEMCSGKERRQWLSVKNRCLRDIPRYEDIIIPILLKSFYHLPSAALKLCFAYCSILSQDFTVEKEQLIQLWMAEGFLVQSNDQRMEDTGEVFFNKLVDGSFLEIVEWDGRGNIRSCKMSRLMHDLALHMPVKVGCLTSLQTLPFFVVGKDSDSTIQELESLNGLRGQLSIYNLQEVKNKTEAEKAN
ncbi:hypothetical protein OIU76_023892 [Salix suchowensis]|nr:hypothetical protein OIU76_023892 [Salix suchowensis]